MDEIKKEKKEKEKVVVSVTLLWARPTDGRQQLRAGNPSGDAVGSLGPCLLVLQDPVKEARMAERAQKVSARVLTGSSLVSVSLMGHRVLIALPSSLIQEQEKADRKAARDAKIKEKEDKEKKEKEVSERIIFPRPRDVGLTPRAFLPRPSNGRLRRSCPFSRSRLSRREHLRR